jgi:hypothetical protein
MGFRAHPGARRRAALPSSTSRLHSVTYRGRGLETISRGAFCSADFIKNGELQRILAKRIDVGRGNSLWWTLATRDAGQIRALFREVFTRLRVRLGHFKLPARRNTFLQSDFSRAEPNLRSLAAIFTLVVLVWTPPAVKFRQKRPVLPGLSCSTCESRRSKSCIAKRFS